MLFVKAPPCGEQVYGSLHVFLYRRKEEKPVVQTRPKMLTYHLIKARRFHSSIEVMADEITFFVPQHTKANHDKTA